MTFTPIPANEPHLTLRVGHVDALVRLLDQIDEFLRDGGGTDALAGYWADCHHLAARAGAILLADDVAFNRDWLCEQATLAHQRPDQQRPDQQRMELS